MLVLLGLLAGCKEKEPTPAVEATVGDLLIEELYYAGAVPDGGTDHYFSDQFIELVNTTEMPLDLSGMLVGNAFGVAGAINPGTSPDSFAESRPERVVLETVWRIPDDTRLEAGQTLVIAHDGTNHRPFSTIDLSGAGLEAYAEISGGDDDHPTVANLESVLYNGGNDWLITVFGPSVAVLEPDSDYNEINGPFGPLASFQREAVIDAIDTVMDGDSGAFKRFPSTVDAGFAYVSGTYTGESLHRKKDGESWVNTDDSSNDFEIGVPDPGRAPESDGVYGDPWIELGGGYGVYQPLDDGDEVPLIAGIQGGWHVDASVRFDGFGPAGVLLVYEAFDLQAQRVSYTTSAELSASSVLAVQQGWQRLGDRVVMEIDDASEVVGEELIVRVTAELDGQTWSDEKRVVVVE